MLARAALLNPASHAARVALVMALLSAVAAAHAGNKPPVKAPVTIEVRGDDFPVLVHETGLPPPLDDNGLPRSPGCEAVRARRVDELPYPWREAVDRIHFDCQPLDSADDGNGNDDASSIALEVTAFLKPGRVWLAGHPVSEIRLMDSELYGDHQYILGADYATVAADVRTHVEAICRQRQLREELASQGDCHMSENPGQLYMEMNLLGGIWIHADAEDSTRTVYAEAWAD